MATVTSIAGGAPKPVFTRLAPAFAAATGHDLNALYDTMSGIAGRVAKGDALDVLVMPLDLLQAYEGEGVVRKGSIAALADIGLAVGVPQGAAVPDISTPEALRTALRAAPVVVHAPPHATPSGAQSDRVIRTLGLIDELGDRVKHVAGLAGGVAMIASGAAALGIFPKSEIATADGVTLAGPLPPSLQLTIKYCAAVTAACPHPDAAAAFIRFLREPAARAVWTACGFDPAP